MNAPDVIAAQNGSAAGDARTSRSLGAADDLDPRGVPAAASAPFRFPRGAADLIVGIVHEARQLLPGKRTASGLPERSFR